MRNWVLSHVALRQREGYGVNVNNLINKSSFWENDCGMEFYVMGRQSRWMQTYVCMDLWLPMQYVPITTNNVAEKNILILVEEK
jgi:hypothetical protein